MTLHKQKTTLAERCPIRDVLDRLSDRWTVLILEELAHGTLRFGEIKKRITDISPRMLSQTLRYLEQDGIIRREAFATIPPRVEYTLTSLGTSFLSVVDQMVQWANTNQAAVRAARQAYIAPESYEAK